MRRQRERYVRLSFVLFSALALASLASVARAQTPPPPVPYLGDADLNHDVKLDVADLVLFLSAWRDYHATNTVAPDADFNHDNKIDAADAVFFIGEWLRAGPTGG
jgi:hypothetical protein